MSEDRAAFDKRLGVLRPKLHRYCARMTGSVVDGEDVLQEALIKAVEAYDEGEPVANLEGWVFRIAHNAALDFLRRRARQDAVRSFEDMEMIADPVSTAEDRALAAASLRTFMRLPPAQRSSVILMDVLGYSLQEIGAVTESTIPTIKASLHRGRARLRELALEPDDQPVPVLGEPERSLFAAYVERFNARDFDTVRDMLAEEVRLDLVNRLELKGRAAVGNYFHRYVEADHWHFVAGFVDGRPAILVRDPKDLAARPKYFVLLEWSAGRIATIRDFLYASYVTDDAELVMLD